MNCIIVDDEPLAREAMKLLIEESDNLQLIGSFNSAATASDFMDANQGVRSGFSGYSDAWDYRNRVCPYNHQKDTGYFSPQPIQNMRWIAMK